MFLLVAVVLGPDLCLLHHLLDADAGRAAVLSVAGVVGYHVFGAEDGLVVANPHHRPDAQLYAFLVVGHGEAGDDVVGLVVMDDDVRVDAPEQVGFHGVFAELLGQLLQHGGTGTARVAVVGGKNLLHLGLQALAFKDVQHLMNQLEVVDAAHRRPVSEVLSVGLLKVVQREDLYLIFSEIQFFHVIQV